MLELCRARGLTLATAESCTGGLVAARLTSVPGSSDVFLGAIVAYANAVKEAAARACRRTLLAAARRGLGRRPRPRWPTGRGRVSAPTSRSRSPGVAGPGGGTAEKPVGLVYLHAETPGASRGIEFTFPADRDVDPHAGRGRRAAPRAAPSVTESRRRRVNSPGSVAGDDRAPPLLRPHAPRRRPSMPSWRGRSGCPADGVQARAARQPPSHAGVSRPPAGAARWARSAMPSRAAAAAAGPIVLRSARATARRGTSGWSCSTTRVARQAPWPPTCTSGSGRSASTSRSGVPGSRTSRSCASGRGRGSVSSLPALGAVSPSGAAVYHSVLRPAGARYVVLRPVALVSTKCMRG